MKSIAAVLGLVSLVAAACPALAVGSLADVSIYDRSTGEILPVYQADGSWYVAGRTGKEYEVHIRNDAGGDLLAVVSVDGVNVVSGETASTSQSGYVIGPWQSLSIQGWRKSLTRVAAFYFTDIGNAYATRTGRPEMSGQSASRSSAARRSPQPSWSNRNCSRRRPAMVASARRRPLMPSHAAKRRPRPRMPTGVSPTTERCERPHRLPSSRALALGMVAARPRTRAT